jgi:transcriptional regulator with XRE-family HTH domain
VTAKRNTSGKQTDEKEAPEFAGWLRRALAKANTTQRQIAKASGVSPSVVNRLCATGVGTDEHVCKILQELNLPRRRALEQVTARKAELAKDEAEKEVWAKFMYPYLDEDECMGDLCGGNASLDRARACTRAGIRLGDVLQLAAKCGLSNLQDINSLDPWKLAEFLAAFERQFGRDKRDAVLAKDCGEQPHILLYDFPQSVDAADYLELTACTGTLLFGLPHMVIGRYEFSKGGQVEAVNMARGVEMAYSVKGSFTITYRNELCPMALTPPKSMFVFDARGPHVIRLTEGEPGFLVTVLYHPAKRDLAPADVFRATK